jgi:RNA polymerase sigma factor (TIGR02999 family)
MERQDHDHTITAALQRLRDGGRPARDELIAAVYGLLVRAAARTKSRWTAPWLETADIAHRAVLRVLDQEHYTWQNRGQFLAVVAETMRRVVLDLIDHERAEKRGGGVRVPLEDDPGAVAPDFQRVLELEEALRRLEARDGRMAMVAVMRCYGGFDLDEIADALEVSRRTVDRLWAFAKAWLRQEMVEATVTAR